MAGWAPERFSAVAIGGIERKKVMRSMEFFAMEVMPALRAEEAQVAVKEAETLSSRP